MSNLQHRPPLLLYSFRQHAFAHGAGGFELDCLTGLLASALDEALAPARTLLWRYQKVRWISVTSATPDECLAGEILVLIVT